MYSFGLREENYFQSELAGVSKIISEVQESGIPVTKFLAPVHAVADFHVRNFDMLTFLNAFLGFVVNENYM